MEDELVNYDDYIQSSVVFNIDKPLDYSALLLAQSLSDSTTENTTSDFE